MQFVNQKSTRLIKWLTIIFLFPLFFVGLVLRIYDKYNNNDESPIRY
ncbi:MAG: hypothetical protein Q7K36_06665 [Fusobacterium sp. JB020]|nr:hypothetical protein [Fusobacterium sp. JB020]